MTDNSDRPEETERDEARPLSVIADQVTEPEPDGESRSSTDADDEPRPSDYNTVNPETQDLADDTDDEPRLSDYDTVNAETQDLTNDEHATVEHQYPGTNTRQADWTAGDALVPASSGDVETSGTMRVRGSPEDATGPPYGPPSDSASTDRLDRYFIGTRFAGNTAEPLFLRLGRDEVAAAGSARYVGGWTEETPVIPTELFDRYQRLDRAEWQEGEAVIRALYGGTEAEYTPHRLGMSQQEAGQLLSDDWGTELVIDSPQVGFVRWESRKPDGVT